MIDVSYLTDSSLINNRCWDFFYITQRLDILCISNVYNQSVPHVVVEASSCFSYLFFITYIYIPYS